MILITGATGVVGRPLVELFVSNGNKVRAISRDPSAAELPSAVSVIGGDPMRPATIAAQLAGVDALFLNPRAVGLAAADLLALAAKHGVRRVVTISAINVDDPLDDQPSRFRGDRNKEVEDAVVGSGMEWVSLRASTYAINSVYAWQPQILAGDVVRGPYPTFAEAPLHEHDLAAVAAHALTTDDLLNRKLDVTGPESLTHQEMVGTIGDVIGRPLRYEQVPVEDAIAGMTAQGLPEVLVRALVRWYERGSRRPAVTTDTVRQVLGRPARDFASWVAEHAPAFRR